ncbi:NAD(P)(+) transhydrogenase (Re/Si-specific) subunit alpha, partial [Oligoflexia bacterium]|nr:NAD(P)(+) transhydrogenase (Re/Si-specific) subunit alpha [Oligoflexia bacterium]
MKIGIPKETRAGETRVAICPPIAKKLIAQGLEVCVEQGAGIAAGFADDELTAVGVTIVDQATALGAEVVFKLNPPTEEEIPQLTKDTLLISFLEPFSDAQTTKKLASAGVNAIGMESIPRTSRAQSMDALSSQANIAGYRAVLEAACRLPRFFPLMMTSAGSAKPAAVAILGAGVAGLQAIATARRLGASVQAYDVRAEVQEQIESLG